MILTSKSGQYLLVVGLDYYKLYGQCANEDAGL